LAGKALPPGDRGIFWGGAPVPSAAATTHFMVAGATGSGKTLTIRLLMQEVLPHIGRGLGHRALVYDAKRDLLSLLHGMGLRCPVVTLHPFDHRCAAWDMAADITSPAAARQVATILIPQEKHSAQPFFADAARHLFTGVLIGLLKTAPGHWTLRDALLVLKSRARLRELLELHPETASLTQYFEPDHTFLCIMSTLATKLAPYEYIAAAWARAGAKISLRQWLQEESILVLGNDETTRSALDPLNRVLFRRLVELTLNQPESETRRTWVFLDEVREAGCLDGLARLLTKGRSKGACVVLGFQDIEGLRDAYGERVAHEITGQCCHKAILRLESPQTAQWAAEIIGAAERLEYRDNASASVGSQGGTAGQNTTEHLSKREVVLPSELMELPPTNRENGLTGYYLTPTTGAYIATLSPQYLAAALRPRATDVADLMERPEDHQYLFDWTTADLSRLGLPPLPEPTPDPPAPKPGKSRLSLLKGIGREP
jgi:type IV secretory pathway TraG/TraD family ATPase VirD4